MFRAFPLPIMSFLLYCISILILLGICHQTCMKYTSAE